MKKTVLVPPLPNSEITRRARESLKGKMFISALILFALILTFYLSTFVVELILTGTVKNIVNGTLAVICNSIGMLAYFKYCGNIADGKDEADFFGHSVPFALKRFARVAIAQWLSAVIVIFFTLLLIIPGIIASFNYFLVYFIVLDNENISAPEALKRSKALMYGHRWQAFCLCCRFIGWSILCLFTLGIGFLWLLPYITTAWWHFYRSVIPENDTPEFQELPQISPCTEMSLVLRIAVFILMVVFASLNDRWQDIKSAEIEAKAEQILNHK